MLSSSLDISASNYLKSELIIICNYLCNLWFVATFSISAIILLLEPSRCFISSDIPLHHQHYFFFIMSKCLLLHKWYICLFFIIFRCRVLVPYKVIVLCLYNVEDWSKGLYIIYKILKTCRKFVFIENYTYYLLPCSYKQHLSLS